jgi:hypothetical protein
MTDWALCVDVERERLADILGIHFVEHHGAATESGRVGWDSGGLPEPALHVEHVVDDLNVVGKEGGGQSHARNLPASPLPCPLIRRWLDGSADRVMAN